MGFLSLANVTNFDSLTETEVRYVCAAVNHFGSGQHPVAEADSLKYFAMDYVNECLNAAQEWERVNS